MKDCPDCQEMKALAEQLLAVADGEGAPDEEPEMGAEGEEAEAPEEPMDAPAPKPEKAMLVAMLRKKLK